MGWGLPGEWRVTSLHPDEPINWMVAQSARDLTPNFYNYGTLFFTLNNLLLGVLHLIGLGVPDPATGTLGGLAQEFVTGRFLSALFGAGMVWLVFAMLFRRVHLYGALAGAAAVLVAPGLVVHSRFMTVDVMGAFFVTLALYFACEAADRPAWRPILGCAIAAGLAAGAKYNGILALVALAPALWAAPRESRWKWAGGAVATAVAVFLVCVPGVFLEREAFMRDVQYELLHVATGHGLVFAGTSPGWVYHWANLLFAFGTLLTFLGVLGLGRLVRNKQAWAIGLGLFFVVFFVLIARAEVKFMRYVFPLIPPLAIGFGWLMARMHEHVNTRWRWGFALGLAGLAGLGGGGTADTANYTAHMLSEDPRETVAKQMRAEVQTVGVVADPWFYTASFYPETVLPRPVPFAQREAARAAAQSPRVLRFVPENPDERMDWDVRLLTELKPEAVVFSSFELEGYERLSRMKPKDPSLLALVEKYEAFRTELQKSYGIDRVVGGGMADIHDMMYIRPTLQVWKRKATSTTP